GGAADRNPLVGVVGMDDGDRRARVIAEISLLRPPDRGVERHDAVLGIDPDDRAVRRAVRPQRRHGADVGILGDEPALLVCELGLSASFVGSTIGNAFDGWLLPRGAGVLILAGARVVAAIAEGNR